MTRRIVWITVAVAVLLTFGGVWFSTHYERVSVRKQQPPQPEALRNPYLALERFMAKMGRPLTRTGDIHALDTLAPGGVLILDRNRRAPMTKARLDALFKWVGNGGYLVVVPETGNMPDPLLAYLHVQQGNCNCKKPAANPSGVNKPAPPAASAPAPAAAEAAAAPVPDFLAVQIPGTERTLTIRRQYAELKAGDISPEWRVRHSDHGDWLLHYRYGTGNVALIANLDYILSNRLIGQYDHAEFLWTLLQHYQPTGAVTLVTQLPMPSLFDWLIDSAWAASISAAVLIALWLWQMVPRFGAAAPDLPPARRELREHLNAVGRFVWRAEGLARWLEVARASFRERLAMRHPALAAMPPHDQAEALAALTARPRQQILSALADAPDNAFEFTAMLRTLKNLKHDL